MRAAIATLAVGALAIVAWLVLYASAAAAMPSYLAAWLVVLGIPMGALPLVLIAEALGLVAGPAILRLRRALLLLPVVSLLAIPVLLRAAPLYHRPGGMLDMPQGWAGTGFFSARMVVILVILSLLAVVFSRPAGQPRRGLAVFGCMLHVCLVTVAAVDWVMGLQPGLNSSAIGLLLIASQLGTATCVLTFLFAVQSRAQIQEANLGLVLSVLLGAWGFLHFIQFLSIWSADLPKEIVWYQARLTDWGTAAMAFGAVAMVVSLALLPSRLARVPAVLASVSAMLLLVHLVETLWLVTPAFRGRFVITAPDALAAIGLGALAIGAVLVLQPTPVRHAR